MKIRSKTAALAEARRRWGREACVRFDGRAPKALARATALEALKAHNQLKPAQKYEAGTMTPEYRAWNGEAHRLLALTHSEPCNVGRVFMGIAFEVRGVGDTWDEAFADADKRVGA